MPVIATAMGLFFSLFTFVIFAAVASILVEMYGCKKIADDKKC